MKTPTNFLLLFVALFPALLNAQCQDSVLPFLRLNTDTHYRGLAETGVTTSGNGQVFLPWQENPALLGNAQDVFAAKSNVYRLQTNSNAFNPTILNVNVQRPLSKRLALGIDAKFFSTGKLDYTDENGQPIGSFRPLEYAITSAVGYQLNEHFSLGGGVSFLQSDITGAALLDLDIAPLRSFALHLGGHYHGEKDLSEMAKLTFEAGLSITNIGPQVSYTNNTVYRNYIPAALQVGGRLGWEGEIKEQQSFGVSLLAQIDHSLVPECNFDDTNGNGINDSQDLGVIRGAFSSFGDHRNGMGGEAQAWIKRVAVHPWVDLHADWKMGAGVGLVQYTIGDTQSFGTLGMNLAYKTFQLEVSNIGRVGSGSGGDLGWSFALGYHGNLGQS